MKKNYVFNPIKGVKIALLNLIVVLFTGSIYAQVVTSNNFNTDFGDWTVVHTLGGSTNAGWSVVESGPNMGSENLPPYAGSGMAMFNAFAIPADNHYELNSPALNFSGGSYQVTFQFYRHDNYNGSYDRIEVFYNTVAGSEGGTSLGVINRVLNQEPVVGQEGWYEYSLEIPGNPDGEGYISIVGISEYGSNMFLDELVVEEVNPCAKPINITYTDITSDSITVNWTAAPDATPESYEYYYSTEDTTPTADTTPAGTTTETMVEITGLEPLTSYNVWVRATCSADSKSYWATAGTLTTACGTYMADFSENFDTTEVLTVPQCWTTIIENSASSYPSLEVSPDYAVSGEHSFVLYNSSDTQGSYYLVSPEFSDLDTYKRVSFQMRREVLYDGTTDNVYNMEVGIMTDEADTATYQTLQDITDQIMVGEFNEIMVDIAGVTSANGHIVIKYNPHEGCDYNKFYVDDFLYKSTLSAEDVAIENNTTVFPNPFTSTIEISNIDNVNAIRILDVTGRVVKSVKAQKQINLKELETGIYIMQLSYNDETIQAVKIIKE